MLLIQNSKLRYSTDTFQTHKSFCYLFKLQLHDTIHIPSKHGCHSVTHSIFPQLRYTPNTEVILSLISRYSPDTLQTRKPFCHLFRFKSPGTTQIQSTYGYHFDVHSPDLQQVFLDGIYKPIYNKILSPLQMASLSPFPQLLHQVQIYGHSSVQSSFTFESRTTKIANLTLQVQED